jgi:uncharacterized membrane protein
MKKKRFDSIDLIKAIGIISMVLIHIALYLTHPLEQANTPYRLLNYLAFIAAPLFLMAAGINLSISSSRRKNSFSHIIKRGIFLIILGLLFINLWKPDIIHYIGFFIIVTFFLLAFNKYLRLLIASVFVITSPVLLFIFGYRSGWDMQLAELWTIKGFIEYLFISGFHPVFPWISFMIIGSVLGELLVDLKPKDSNSFLIKNYILGLFLVILGILTHLFTSYKILFYPATLSYVFICSGISLFLFALSFWLLDIKTGFNKIFRPLTFLGKVSLSIYILHILIGLSYFYFTDSFYRMYFIAAFLYGILLIAVTGAICYFFFYWLGYGPFEYLMKKLLSSRK